MKLLGDKVKSKKIIQIFLNYLIKQNNMPDIKNINLVSQNSQSTVVAKYTPSPRKVESYQSEDSLEKEFIAQLKSQEYEYLPINHEKDLISNLKKQLEKLNNYQFTDNEWKYFFEKELANPNKSIKEKTRTIQEDYIKNLQCDN